jgi:hypothetical protein
LAVFVVFSNLDAERIACPNDYGLASFDEVYFGISFGSENRFLKQIKEKIKREGERERERERERDGEREKEEEEETNRANRPFKLA